jgi:hypothetical protein
MIVHCAALPETPATPQREEDEEESRRLFSGDGAGKPLTEKFESRVHFA